MKISKRRNKTKPNLRYPEYSDPWYQITLLKISKNGFSNGVFNDPKKIGSGYRLINVKDMYQGDNIQVDTLTLVNIAEKEFENNKAEYGDIFFTRSSLVREGIAHSNILLDEKEDITFDGHLIKMSPNTELVYPVFLNYALKTTLSRKQLVARGKTTTMTTIGQEDIASAQVCVCALEEQQKIAAFLSSFDTKIEQLDKKKVLLEQYKKGMMQKLFSQELRFKDDQGNYFPDWVIEHLDNIAKRVTKKNTDNSITRVLTNSAIQGVLEQGDYFDNNVANKDNLAGYYIVRKGDYVYNPRISASAPVGPINKNELADGVISPLYTVFRFNSSENEFYKQYFKSSVWYKYMYSVANYGARHDRMSISTSDFTKMPLPAPCNREQQKISDFLSAIDKKIELVSIELEQARTFKKGLLQQMFV